MIDVDLLNLNNGYIYQSFFLLPTTLRCGILLKSVDDTWKELCKKILSVYFFASMMLLFFVGYLQKIKYWAFMEKNLSIHRIQHIKNTDKQFCETWQFRIRQVSIS